MTNEELKEWTRLTKKYPALAGKAWELYARHEKKNARVVTYFMWAGKYERRDEKRYQEGLKKYRNKEQVKMELKKWLEN